MRLHGLRLRLFLHLVIPGNPMSWSARTPFSGVFPLFGMPRRYWGRFVWIRGDLLFMGVVKLSDDVEILSITEII